MTKRASPGRKRVMADDPSVKEAITEELVERLEAGESLLSICADDRMPNARTVQRWQTDDPAFDVAITRARETGHAARAERAVEAAKSATDAALGRLAFDAERWYLGKLSNAFRDKVTIAGDPAAPLVHKHDMTGLTEAQLEALAALGEGDAAD